jgi:Leucine Rich repeat
LKISKIPSSILGSQTTTTTSDILETSSRLATTSTCNSLNTSLVHRRYVAKVQEEKVGNVVDILKRIGATVSLPIFLALEIQHIPIICAWHSVQTLGLLDIAVSSNDVRKLWLEILKSITSKTIDEWRHSHLSIKWVIDRRIRVTQVLVNVRHRNEVSDLTFEAVGISSGTVDDEEGGDEYILSIWEGCQYLLSVGLGGCKRITDVGLSALAHGCSQLQTIHLSGCDEITDVGISALGHGCSRLQTINLNQCYKMTDIGLSALAHGCSQLKSIVLSSCNGITDIGLSVLAGRCGELQTIDLSDCQGITDIGISALGHGCGELQKINLSHCQGIIDIGISALSHGCGQLQSIDLGSCQGITDNGISALADRCGQLQTINLSQCYRMTNIGLSAISHG